MVSCGLSKESVDGFGRVVLSGGVTQFGDDVGLVDDGPGKGGGLACVESTAAQQGIGDGRK